MVIVHSERGPVPDVSVEVESLLILLLLHSEAVPVGCIITDQVEGLKLTVEGNQLLRKGGDGQIRVDVVGKLHNSHLHCLNRVVNIQPAIVDGVVVGEKFVFADD